MSRFLITSASNSSLVCRMAANTGSDTFIASPGAGCAGGNRVEYTQMDRNFHYGLGGPSGTTDNTYLTQPTLLSSGVVALTDVQFFSMARCGSDELAGSIVEAV